ncbi:MAG: hypothetical protein NTW19_17255 [Planctomycetota bacterium]|nr:hypothetical protein [Planctomycetota bacterium]
MQRKTCIMAWAVGGVACAVVFAFVAVRLWTSLDSRGTRAFVKAEWSDPAKRNLRWNMLHDLQRGHLKVGTPMAKVCGILGDADRTIPASEMSDPSPGEAMYLRYDLGLEHAEFDCCELVVSFDSNNRLLRSFVFSN